MWNAAAALLFIGGSLFVSAQDSHRPGTSPDMPTAGVGGTTWGGTAEAGAFLTPVVSVGVEWSWPARLEAIQETDYSIVFQDRNRYRDMTVAFVAKAYTPGGRRVRAAAVGGVGFVQESVFQSVAYARGPFPILSRDFGPFGAETEYTRWTPALVVGGDIEMMIAPHLSVVPQVRASWVSRSADPSQPMWFLGLNAFVLRGSVGLRAAF